MTERIDVQLIVGAEYHDSDYVRRELLDMLARDDLLRVHCDSGWPDVASFNSARMLITYTSNNFPGDMQRRHLERFLQRGGRWLAIHGSAAYTEFRPPEIAIGPITLPGLTDSPDRQPEYMDLLGCRFVSHLAPQEIEIRSVSDHPLVADLPPFRVVDEPYVLELRGECEVLLESRYVGEAPGYVEGPWLEDQPRPQLLLHKVGDGEVLYLAPGHACGRFDLRPFIEEMPVQHGPWIDPTYREIIARAIRWGTRRDAISLSSKDDSETERNKALVIDFLARSEAGGDILCLLADEVEWLVPGNWELSGTYRKDELPAVFGLILDDLIHPPVFTIHSITSEDDRVAVHAENRSKFRDGEPFANTYHFLFHVRDGLITKVHEYMDTQYMSTVVHRRYRKGGDQ